MSVDTVWPWWLRLCHWIIACGVIGLWILVYGFYETDMIHRCLGYAVFGLVLVRVLMGFFTQSVSARHTIPTLQAIISHIRQVRQQQMLAIYGHNPLGQIAVYVMWLLITLLAFTGWLSQTDAYWGEDWPVHVHHFLSDVLFCMVALHVVAVMWMSRLQRKSLVRAMLTGK